MIRAKGNLDEDKLFIAQASEVMAELSESVSAFATVRSVSQ